MKLHVHHHTMVIYIQYKFDEIPSIGYVVMAEDGKTEGWGEPQTYIPPPRWGIITQHAKSQFCLFDLILYVPSTIFQLNRDGSSWVEPLLS